MMSITSKLFNKNIISNAIRSSSISPLSFAIGRNFSSTELKPNLDQLEEFPPYISENDNNNNNDNDCRQKFFEQYVCHELMIEKNDAREIYHLYSDSIQKYYPHNESLIHLCKFLKMFFTSSDISLNPKPFAMPFQKLHNRILLLKEIGFRSFHISMMDFTSEILKLNLYQIKKYLNYPENQNCFETICKVLEINGDSKLKLMAEIKENHGDLEKIPLQDLRIICIAYYLSTNLNISFNRSLHLCRRYLKHLNETNLLAIKTNVNYLQNYFNYSNNKIFHNGLFLFTNPENLNMIYSKLKMIVGDHMYGNMISQSQILKLDFSQIIYNYDLIKQKCNGRFLTRSIELLSIDPSNLETMFNQLERNEDIKLIKLDILGWDFLAINKRKILERIDRLKEEEIPLDSVPLSIFSSNDSEFERVILDLTTDPDLRIRFFLRTRFNLDYDKIKHRLYVIPNLNTEKYCSINANRIIEFFISMNIDKDLIINFVYLILYDYKQIKSAYSYLCSHLDKNVPKDINFFQNLIDHLERLQSSYAK